MRARRSLVVDAVAAASIAGLVLAAIAIAHPASNWYDFKFPANDRNQTYRYHSNVPTSGGFRNRVLDGAKQWNQAGGALKFGLGGPAVTWTHNTACSNRSRGENSVHYAHINRIEDSGGNLRVVLGNARICAAGSSIRSFIITFNSSFVTWYTGTGATPSNRHDLWAVASHEFGHAGGFGVRPLGSSKPAHFPDSLAICGPASNPPPGRHTMCSGLRAGDRYKRWLQEHDKHTFRNAY